MPSNPWKYLLPAINVMSCSHKMNALTEPTEIIKHSIFSYFPSLCCFFFPPSSAHHSPGCTQDVLSWLQQSTKKKKLNKLTELIIFLHVSSAYAGSFLWKTHCTWTSSVCRQNEIFPAQEQGWAPSSDCASHYTWMGEYFTGHIVILMFLRLKKRFI